MIRFSYFPGNIHANRPIGTVTLDDFYRAIRDPKPQVKEKLLRIRSGVSEKEKSGLKRELYFFTPCIISGITRTYDNIREFTGLAVMDFDKLDPVYAEHFKKFLFNEYDFIYAAWLSASGAGVRALVNIPKVSSVKEYKFYYSGLETDVGRKHPGYDSAPKNPVLPLFISYDPKILIREEPSLWDTGYEEQLPTTSFPMRGEAHPELVEEIIRARFEKITGNGHPQLRAAAYRMGMYVRDGHIAYQRAYDFLIQQINSNPYLSSFNEGKLRTYHKTATDMLYKGYKQPNEHDTVKPLRIS